MVFVSGGVYADTTNVKSQSEINAEASTTGHIAKDAKTAWKDVKNDASTVYEEMKASFVGEKNEIDGPIVVIQTRKTVNGIISQPVFNEKGESVAKVTDIILDKNDKAIEVIVSDGRYGMGKKVAFNYDDITRIENDGDIVIPLTEKVIDNAIPFSYDKDDAKDIKHVMPVDSVSVARLLDGSLLDYKGKKLADIDNLILKNGYASKVILGFDKTFGQGGEKAAMNFADVKIMRDGDDLDIQMSEKQSAIFEVYKKSVTK